MSVIAEAGPRDPDVGPEMVIGKRHMAFFLASPEVSSKSSLSYGDPEVDHQSR